MSDILVYARGVDQPSHQMTGVATKSMPFLYRPVYTIHLKSVRREDGSAAYIIALLFTYYCYIYISATKPGYIVYMQDWQQPF